MTTQQNQTRPLQNAPARVEPPTDPRPDRFRAEFIVKTEHGYQVAITAEDLTPKDVIAWIKLTDKGLDVAGFAPVDRFPAAQVHVEAGAAPAADAPRGRGRPSGGGGGSKYKGEVYTICPWCESDVYNNLPRKEREPNWRGPFFKCKECDFVVFKADGTPNE